MPLHIVCTNICYNHLSFIFTNNGNAHLPAILYLPHGFAGAGYVVAIPVLMLSTMLFLWSSNCLLQSWKAESDRLNKKRLSMNNSGCAIRLRKRIKLSYPELAYMAFGIRGEKLVQVGITLMQSGVCLTYLIFVPQNLRSSAQMLFNWDISTNLTLVLMMAIQIPLSFIKDIRRKIDSDKLIGKYPHIVWTGDLSLVCSRGNGIQ